MHKHLCIQQVNQKKKDKTTNTNSSSIFMHFFSLLPCICETSQLLAATNCSIKNNYSITIFKLHGYNVICNGRISFGWFSNGQEIRETNGGMTYNNHSM